MAIVRGTPAPPDSLAGKSKGPAEIIAARHSKQPKASAPSTPSERKSERVTRAQQVGAADQRIRASNPRTAGLEKWKPPAPAASASGEAPPEPDAKKDDAETDEAAPPIEPPPSSY